MSNYIFNKTIQDIGKKIKKVKVKAMISLELIFVLGVLGFIVQKFVTMTYTWVQNFYLMNSVLLLANSYIQLPLPIETIINNTTITTNKKEKTLTICNQNEHTILSLKNFLISKMIENPDNYQINLVNNTTLEVNLK
jgi:hypothetical protein